MTLTIYRSNQDALETEFKKVITEIAIYMRIIEGSDPGNGRIATVLGRRRTWINRRLQDKGTPNKVSVELTDIFAIKYLRDKLEEASSKQTAEVDKEKLLASINLLIITDEASTT